MNKWLRYILIGLLAIALLLVRYFETSLFNDPFISFFKNEFYNMLIPDFSWSTLILSLGFRFVLNTVLSLGILYLVFEDLKMVKAAAAIYGLSFSILLVVFVILLTNDNPSLNVLFYVRRFIIQPILLLLLLPAFYYHRLNN